MDENRVTILADIPCQLGEGPTYDPATDTLFWFDIIERKLLEKKFPDGPARVHDLPVMASALAVIDAGRQLLVTETGLHVRDIGTGQLTLHTPLEADNRGTRSNDSRVHPCGAFWIGTMGKKAERGAGSIYWFFKGEVRQLYPGISIPNSICFSPDGRTAYFADTKQNIAWRVDCDPLTGLPTGEPKVFLDYQGKRGGMDGSIVDAEGNIWNAYWGEGRVDVYSPAGRLIRSIAVPARQTSCPAFVGPDAGRIAVTTAWEHMDEAARHADPEAGKTFLLPVAVKGRFESNVLL